MPRLLQLLNRHGSSSGMFVMFLGACAGSHFMAIFRMAWVPEVFAVPEPRMAARVALIELVNAHLWIALPYLALVLPGLFLLELFGRSRRAIFCAWTIFGLPFLCYSWVCLRIGATPIKWVLINQ